MNGGQPPMRVGSKSDPIVTEGSRMLRFPVRTGALLCAVWPCRAVVRRRRPAVFPPDRWPIRPRRK